MAKGSKLSSQLSHLFRTRGIRTKVQEERQSMATGCQTLQMVEVQPQRWQ